MTHNPFTTVYRQISKNKFYSFINVFGLSLGLAASVLALMFVLDELSFDRFHHNASNLYRLNKISKESDGSTFLNAESSGMMGPTMVDEFPEVEKVVRYQPWYNTLVLSYQTHNAELEEAQTIFADSTFFEVFDFELVSGNPNKVLTRPSTVVLTEAIAHNLFGDEDPIGKSVIGINGLEFEVTGIAKEAPRNSHMQYKAIVSWTTTTPHVGPLDMEYMNNWIAQALTTYVLLKPGADVSALQAKFPKFMRDHMPTRVDTYQLYLQPFTELYLHANEVKYHRMTKTGSLQFLYLFSVIAVFILFIACINYINISTSRSTRRAREVGMRKSLGASRLQLIKQFLGESLLITLISSLLAIILLYTAVPWFNELVGKSLQYELLGDIKVISGMVSLIIVVTLLAGLYPAFILAAFRPSEVLKISASNKLTGHLPSPGADNISACNINRIDRRRLVGVPTNELCAFKRFRF